MTLKTVFVDMDGVLADYYSLVNALPIPEGMKRIPFRELVIKRQIFKYLQRMRHSGELIYELVHLKEIYNFELIILSSLGSYIDVIWKESKNQKLEWLKEQPIIRDWPAVFTHCGESKARFASPEVLLIDDNNTNCINFEFNEGHSILYDADDKDMINNIVMKIVHVAAQPK